MVIVLKGPDLVPAAQKPISVLKRADYHSRLCKSGPSQTSVKNELIWKGNIPVLNSLPFCSFSNLQIAFLPPCRRQLCDPSLKQLSRGPQLYAVYIWFLVQVKAAPSCLTWRKPRPHRGAEWKRVLEPDPTSFRFCSLLSSCDQLCTFNISSL